MFPYTVLSLIFECKTQDPPAPGIAHDGRPHELPNAQLVRQTVFLELLLSTCGGCYSSRSLFRQHYACRIALVLRDELCESNRNYYSPIMSTAAAHNSLPEELCTVQHTSELYENVRCLGTAPKARKTSVDRSQEKESGNKSDPARALRTGGAVLWFDREKEKR